MSPFLQIFSSDARIARVAGIQSGKAGVMIRQTLDAASANAFIMISNTSTPMFAYRTATGNNTVNASASGILLPYWVKLVRQGTTFSGYASPDGSVCRST